MSNENKFELLFECYISGQMTEKQWQDHLRYDVGLKEWHDKYRAEKKAIYEEKFDKLRYTGSV